MIQFPKKVFPKRRVNRTFAFSVVTSRYAIEYPFVVKAKIHISSELYLNINVAYTLYYIKFSNKKRRKEKLYVRKSKEKDVIQLIYPTSVSNTCVCPCIYDEDEVKLANFHLKSVCKPNNGSHFSYTFHLCYRAKCIAHDTRKKRNFPFLCVVKMRVEWERILWVNIIN